MKMLVPISICAAFTAVLFVLTITTPWYTISYESKGEVKTIPHGLQVAHGDARAKENYCLLKQVNTTQGTVYYQFDKIYEWDDSHATGYSDQGGFKSMFLIQFVLVLLEMLLFIGNGVLLVLASFKKMNKIVLLVGLSVFVLLLIASSVYLPMALPPKIEEEPENHLPGSVHPRLNESNRAFEEYGVSPQVVNRTIDEVMDVEYSGGLYGSDSSKYEASVEGGDFTSRSYLSWYPSIGWIAHILVGVLGVLMLIMAFKLDIGKKKAEPTEFEFQESEQYDSFGRPIHQVPSMD
jgi:hypothetical protein